MRPLDEVLAERQRRFYDAAGASAFHGAVPFRLSTSRAMARLVLAAARAFAAARGAARLHLIDVGAGSGRLVFHLAQRTTGEELRLSLTDGSRAMVDGWSAHPGLAALASEGRVGFHHVRAEQPEALRAIVAPREGEATVLVGTYLLDTLPHVLLEAPLGALASLAEDGAPHFGQPSGDPFVRRWAQRLGQGTAFVPSGAFDFLRAVEGCLAGPALVLLADKGARTLDEAREGPSLRLATHAGGASVFVNFEALRSWLGWRGWVEAPGNEPDFVISATVLARGRAVVQDVGAALACVPHPLQVQRRVTALRTTGDAGLVSAVLSMEPDGDVLLELADGLVLAAPGLTAALREALGGWLLEAVRDAFFLPVDDVAFHAGRVLQRLGFAGAAASCFGHSLQHHGDAVSTRFNLAVCLYELGERGRARQELGVVLAREPGHAQALELLERVAQ